RGEDLACGGRRGGAEPVAHRLRYHPGARGVLEQLRPATVVERSGTVATAAFKDRARRSTAEAPSWMPRSAAICGDPAAGGGARPARRRGPRRGTLQGRTALDAHRGSRIERNHRQYASSPRPFLP